MKFLELVIGTSFAHKNQRGFCCCSCCCCFLIGPGLSGGPINLPVMPQTLIWESHLHHSIVLGSGMGKRGFHSWQGGTAKINLYPKTPKSPYTPKSGINSCKGQTKRWTRDSSPLLKRIGCQLINQPGVKFRTGPPYPSWGPLTLFPTHLHPFGFSVPLPHFSHSGGLPFKWVGYPTAQDS